MDRVKVFAPATVANLGVGFDILGMAVEGMGDVVTVARTDTTGIAISDITGDGGKLPRIPAKNTAAISAKVVLATLGITGGISITIEKGLPLASGLGSSAASAVAAAVATNALFGNQLPLEGLLPACLEAEASVSGRHADNVAPCLLGGILLINGIEAHQIYHLPIPDNFVFALVTPDVAVPTAQARAVLPKQVPLKSAVHQTKALATLMHALYTNNIELFVEAMAQDILIEPARQHLIPYFTQAREVALQNGALAMVISGAGPTLCLPALTPNDAQRAGEVVAQVYRENGIGALVHVGRPSPQGAIILQEGA